jgi:hypothetical protein
MNKMYGLVMALALGAAVSMKAGLVYPIEFQNRTGQKIEIWLYDKPSNTPYAPNVSNPSGIYLKDNEKSTFNIGSTDLVRANVIIGNSSLTVDLVAPYKKYYINKNKSKGTFDASHNNAKSILVSGTSFREGL